MSLRITYEIKPGIFDEKRDNAALLIKNSGFYFVRDPYELYCENRGILFLGNLLSPQMRHKSQSVLKEWRNNGQKSLDNTVFFRRNRILVSSILFLASLAFLALILLPVLGVFRTGAQVAETPSPTSSPTAGEDDLEARARGYSLVLEREPDNQTALRGLLEVRIQQGDAEAAIAPLERLAALNPDVTDYQVLLAQTKQRTGDSEGAARVYREILSQQPGDMNALQGLVGLMVMEGRPEAAIALLQDTLRIADEQNQVSPGSISETSVQLLLGQVYAEEQRFDEAIAIYDQAIESDRQDFRPVLGKAIVLQADGQTDEADPLFRLASSLAPAQYQDQINQLAGGTLDAANPADEISPLNPPAGEPGTDAEADSEPSSSSRVTGNPQAE